MKDTSSPDITIKATGYQWNGATTICSEGISFYSTLATPRDQIEERARRPKGEHYLLEVDNPLVVPVGKKVRIITTANDVIHAWWVPAFGVKQDAIPGFVRDTWFKADKPAPTAASARSCAARTTASCRSWSRSVSRREVRRMGRRAEEETWPRRADDPSKNWTLAELKARGEKVYAANCVACHQANGMGVPGAFPALAGSQDRQRAEGRARSRSC